MRHERKNFMNFRKWVMDRYLLEDSPEGDLARDMQKDVELSKLNDDNSIFEYLALRMAYHNPFSVYKKLKNKYLKSLK